MSSNNYADYFLGSGLVLNIYSEPYGGDADLLCQKEEERYHHVDERMLKGDFNAFDFLYHWGRSTYR